MLVLGGILKSVLAGDKKVNAEKDAKKWSGIRTQSSALVFLHLNYPEMISL